MLSKNNMLISRTTANERGHLGISSLFQTARMFTLSWKTDMTSDLCSGLWQHLLQPSVSRGSWKGADFGHHPCRCRWQGLLYVLMLQPQAFCAFLAHLLKFSTLEQGMGTESGGNHLELENKKRLDEVAWSLPSTVSFKFLSAICFIAIYSHRGWFLPRPTHCSHCKWLCLFLLYAVISPGFCQRLLAWKNWC